jgi:hypothetical protein
MLLVLVAGLGSVAWTWLGEDAPVVRVPPLEIEVLNGCGEAGAAQRAAERLQGLGHDVIRVDDADSHEYARTVMVDRRGRDRITRELARRLGPCPLVLEQGGGTDADVTLILGADWREMGLFSTRPRT